jgi:hypothetical protein
VSEDARKRLEEAGANRPRGKGAYVAVDPADVVAVAGALGEYDDVSRALLAGCGISAAKRKAAWAALGKEDDEQVRDLAQKAAAGDRDAAAKLEALTATRAPGEGARAPTPHVYVCVDHLDALLGRGKTEG